MNTSSTKRVQDMDPMEIKIKLMRSGIQQKEIARSLGVSGTAISQVIANKLASHQIRQAISAAIGVDIKKIWPSTYLYGGGPRKPGRPASDNEHGSIIKLVNH